MILATTLLLAALAGPVAPQDAGSATTAPATATAADAAPTAGSDTRTRLTPLGGIEAPTQPTGTSSATVRRVARDVPSTAPGTYRPQLASPVRSLVAVRGQEDNQVMGIGLVTGLAGTGDTTDAARQVLQNLLRTRDINIPLQQLSSKNIAVVRVEANLPSGFEPGRRLDVRVSTIGDAKSLLGGTLAMCELTDITGALVYATASGPVTVGGFSFEGAGANASRNHVTVGVIANGGKVEREVPTSVVTEHGWIYLDLRIPHGSFGNAVRIAESVNRLFPQAARVEKDGRTVKVRVPADLPEEAHVAYLDTLLQLEIQTDDYARVIVNERTGVIVMGGNVRLRPGAIAQGNLTVTISETPEASQPGPLSGGNTERLERTTVDVEEESTGLVLIPGAVTLQEVVDILNVLGTPPRDLISILQAMSQAGLLVADIYSM